MKPTCEELISFAKTILGQELKTASRQRPFTVDVADDGFVFTPATGVARGTTDRKRAEKILARFAETGSLRPGDYQGITFNASYFLSLLSAYQQEHLTKEGRSASVQLTPRFDRAVAFARIVHGGEVRKGTTIPYLSHLIQVAGIVLEFGGTETEAIAALLHDAAEDAGGEAMLCQIEADFGPEVASIVRENSDSITESKDDKAPWRERKEAYIAAIPHKSRSACLVSIADKIHNARSLLSDQHALGDAHWSRFNCTKAESLRYYRCLAEAFAKRTADFPVLARPVETLNVVVRELLAESSTTFERCR